MTASSHMTSCQRMMSSSLAAADVCCMSGSSPLPEQGSCVSLLVCHVTSFVTVKTSLVQLFDMFLDVLLTQQIVLLSCLVLSCLVLSCLVLSCLVLSCLVLSCLVLSCLVLSCLVLSCLVLSCLVLSLGLVL